MWNNAAFVLTQSSPFDALSLAQGSRAEWPAMSKRQRVEWLPRMDSNHE
jgi:hypothetical protein